MVERRPANILLYVVKDISENITGELSTLEQSHNRYSEHKQEYSRVSDLF